MGVRIVTEESIDLDKFPELKSFLDRNRELVDFLESAGKISYTDKRLKVVNFCGYLGDEEFKVLLVPKKLKDRLKINSQEDFDSIFYRFLHHIIENLHKEKIIYTLSLFETPIEESETNPSLIFKLLLLLKEKEQLINSIHLILSNPHRKLVEYESYKTLPEVSYVDERVLTDIIQHPEFLYETENGIIQDKYSPISVLQYEVEETFDTLENRFVKHFLKEIQFFLDKEAKEFLDIKDLKEIKEEIEYCLQSDVFSEVRGLNYFPSNSQVLMKKAGYREIFQIYRYFHLSFVPKFARDLDMAFSLKDMATLWEYHVLIKLLHGLKKGFGNHEITEDFKEGKIGKTIYEKAEFKFEKGLKLYFQLTKISYSELKFRPDFLIEYENEIYIFDAKFRVIEDEDEKNDEREKNNKRKKNNRKDILQNMHYYKDGLNAKFAIAVCFGEESKGEFYFRKRGKSNISFEDVIGLIGNNEYDGVGYVNLSLEGLK